MRVRYRTKLAYRAAKTANVAVSDAVAARLSVYDDRVHVTVRNTSANVLNVYLERSDDVDGGFKPVEDDALVGIAAGDTRHHTFDVSELDAYKLTANADVDASSYTITATMVQENL